MLLLWLLGALFSGLAATPVAAQTAADRSYIVVLRDPSDAPAVASAHASAFGLRLEHVYRHVLRGYAATIPATRLDRIKADPRVLFVAEDAEVRTADVRRATGQTLPTGVDRIDAELSSRFSADPSTWPLAVAVIDTGVGPHADLNVAGGVNCHTSDRPNPGNFGDGNGHGTHVAGTIGARNNAAGVVGVAPGVRLYAVRVLGNNGSGRTSHVLCGIEWVTANASALGIKVANMSLGGFGFDDGNCGLSNFDPQHLAICNSVAAGVTYVVAAGNEERNLVGTIPAAYNEVLTVTAMSDSDGKPAGLGGRPDCRTEEQDDAVAGFSNFGMPGGNDVAHTVAGPGVCIVSTVPTGLCDLCDPSGLAVLSGSSMATPHVAGTVALCIASGRCSGPPSTIMARLRADAALANLIRPGYGFAGDPLRPVAGRYYGFLVYAGGY
jgi:subtilisin family serine protease